MASDGEWSRPPRNTFENFFRKLYAVIDGPVTWFREHVVESNRPKYPYYHRVFRRVPEIDQCYEGDVACVMEANAQFNRDRKVDSEIVNILRQRREDCVFYEHHNYEEKCKQVVADYAEAELNWFIKYGDLGARPHVINAYMKQKHRLIWERRYGPNDGSKPHPMQ